MKDFFIQKKSSPPRGIPVENVLDLRAAARKRQEEQVGENDRQKWVHKWHEELLSQKKSDGVSDVDQEAVMPENAPEIPINIPETPRVRLEKQPPRPPAPPSSPGRDFDDSDDSNTSRWRVISIYRFAVIAVLLILPIAGFGFFGSLIQSKGKVLGESISALKDFQRGSEAITQLNALEAKESFANATASFEEAEQEIRRYSALTTFIPIKEAQSGEALVQTGVELSRAAENLSTIVSDLTTSNAQTLSDALQKSQKSLEEVQGSLDHASEEIQKVDLDVVPKAYQETISVMQSAIPKLVTLTERAQTVNALFLGMLGFSGDKRYLVVFQNSAEMRPTGGFLGSFALMRVRNGEMKELTIPEGGTYDISGVSTARVEPPAPLLLANDRWEFQDANFAADFPFSAKKIRWFYQQSGGPSTDGVLALDTYVLETLLRITGPVDLTKEEGVVIDSENVVDVLLEKINEEKQTAHPKKILGILAPRLLERVFSESHENYLELLTELDRLLSEKHILLYLDSEELQQQVKDLGWSGEVRETDGDFLMVVDTNITGGKTDLAIEQWVDDTVHIEEGGSIVHDVTITRTHKGDPKDPFEGVVNKNYVRLYVPKGSTLLSAKGFDTVDPRLFFYPREGLKPDEDWDEFTQDEGTDASGMRVGTEGEKTVFGNWVMTEAGKSTQVKIRYRVPEKLSFDGWLEKTGSYHLIVQKQSGTVGRVVKTTLVLPASLEAIWKTHKSTTSDGLSSPLQWTSTLTKDAMVGVVLKKIGN